jgi:acyl-CoA synthetase (NDP forming)
LIGLGTLFNPTPVAVIGASQNPQKVGYTILNNLLKLGYQGKIRIRGQKKVQKTKEIMTRVFDIVRLLKELKNR